MLHRLPDRQGYNSPWFGYRLTPPCLQSSKPNLARIVDSPAGISDAVGTPNPPPGLRPSFTKTLIFPVSRVSQAFPSFPGRHFDGKQQKLCVGFLLTKYQFQEVGHCRRHIFGLLIPKFYVEFENNNSSCNNLPPCRK